MKHLFLAILLATSSMPLSAQCNLGNGEIVSLGHKISIPHTPSIQKLAKKLIEKGVVSSMDEAIVEAKKYDGVYIVLECKQVVKLKEDHTLVTDGFSLVSNSSLIN